jgi:hypothetical protein
MNSRSKIKLKTILIFATSFIYIALIYKGIIEQNINLKSYKKLTSTVVDKGLGYRHGSKGHEALCFYISLQGEEKKLGVYRSNKIYNDLLKKFIIGDTVTAFYKDNKNKAENINTDLIQASNKKGILLSKREYEQKEKWLIYIGALGWLFTVACTYLYYKQKI